MVADILELLRPQALTGAPPPQLAGGGAKQPPRRQQRVPAGRVDAAYPADWMAAGELVGEPGSDVVLVAGEHLVASLAVEEHLRSVLVRERHHLTLRHDAPGAVRFVLLAADGLDGGREVVRLGRVPGVRAGRLRHRLCMRPLVVPGAAGREREGLKVGAGVREAPLRQRDQGRRVETAGQAAPDRDVAPQTEPYGIVQELADALAGWFAGVRSVKPGCVRAPVGLVLDERTCLDLPDVRERGLPWHRVDPSRVEEALEHGLVRPRLDQAGLQQCLDLGGEREAVADPRKVEGFDPEAVAREHQPFAGGVPDRLRPHAVEALEAVRAPLAVGGERDLRVARPCEAVAARRELGAEFDVVVDLAVVHDPVAAVGRAQRLVAAGGQVQDGEAARGENDVGGLRLGPGARQERERSGTAALGRIAPGERHRPAGRGIDGDVALVVRSAMAQPRRHRPDRGDVGGRAPGDSGDPAHGRSLTG